MIAMKSIKRSLSAVLPVSLEEHILENILGHLNLLDEDANETLRLDAAEEEKPIMSSLYQHLSHVYSKIRTGLFTFDSIGDSDSESENASGDESASESSGYSMGSPKSTRESISQIQKILSEFSKTEDDTDEETDQEDEGGEIMGAKELEVQDGDDNEVKMGGEDEEEDETKLKRMKRKRKWISGGKEMEDNDNNNDVVEKGGK